MLAKVFEICATFASACKRAEMFKAFNTYLRLDKKVRLMLDLCVYVCKCMVAQAKRVICCTLMVAATLPL